MFFSLLIGNLFFFFEFNNAAEIEASKRMILFAVLTVVAVIGMLIMFLIRNVTVVRQSSNDLLRYCLQFVAFNRVYSLRFSTLMTGMY